MITNKSTLFLLPTPIGYILCMHVGESNPIRTVTEYGYSRYLRNHKSYKKL